MYEISGATTIGDIVAHDLRKAAVFSRHGLDFCCGGSVALADACRGREIDPGVVLAELRAVERSPEAPLDVSSWPLEHVIERIVGRHHIYARKQIPVVDAYLERLTARHGGRHPELTRIASVFGDVAITLVRHIKREELVLFPYIEELASAERSGHARPEVPFGSAADSIRVMEDEHRSAAAGLGLLRALTDDYRPPTDACATWHACYEALEAFERDLQQHVHLENNVLFPAALHLEAGDELNRTRQWVC